MERASGKAITALPFFFIPSHSVAGGEFRRENTKQTKWNETNEKA
jgi:hypothetical protein